MEHADTDIPDEPQELDLQSLKRAMKRRDEAVERFRAAKQQMLRPRTPQDLSTQDQPPHQG